MKKRMFFMITLISVVASLSACILTSFVYYEFYSADARSQIRTITQLSREPEKWDDEASIKTSVNNILKSVDYTMRFTIVDKSGAVVYDNWANSQTLENHGNRTEIKNAFEYGYGEDTRYSNTISSDMYYFAVKLNDNSVLRISREIKSINSVFAGIIPLLAVLFVMLFVVVYVSANSFTKKILRPVNEMTGALDDMLEGDSVQEIKIYDEFRPLAHKIRDQKMKISKYVDELRHERDTIGIITENMKEGFILINRNKYILSINQSGKDMMRNHNFNLQGSRNILELTRNTEIIESIDKAINENMHLTLDVDTGKNFYRYYLSPVKEQSEILVTGILILIEDITFQKKSEIMRSEFSANVSHELKTPLTTMIGFAEMIKEGLITDSESIKKYCGMVHKEGLRLISLIEDIIRLSKIEEGIDENETDEVDLKETATEVVSLLRHKAEDSNVDLTLKSEDVIMKANKNYMSELLYNLVDNAVKYNKNGGKVHVDISTAGGFINIVVKDTGTGIPEEHQLRVFERFYRVDKSRSKETGGTGLGLSIVKHIAELYDGTIELKSRENVGTEITVQFHAKEV